MSTEDKYFTIDEANAVVPQLLVDVPRLQGLMNDLTHKYPDVKKARENAQLNGGSVEGTDYVNCILQINFMSERLESRGCILKGIKNGLVDFLALRDGREVYFCWKSPEPKIEYWHDIQAGFAGRQRI
ncbi:MAG TPA: DUF2203 domain-containing protein [Nitrospinaceae bacterium]|jgi:hypothetical protein|nr:hypothetical protein [Nitrospinota bacterium]MDP6335884.1 DUF2203 domain-containing protein [Nitrospinaceae bacterium]HAX46295.1 DUF2203 domain-containing protein [Nitrospina sp.]MBV51320.1 hypothetical protein [Nitrospinota bacterium]MDP7147831.1 DUF2203 domain-containing protein [Nitrospinaceae bacterium]|tara:strand:+ start:294 stop:677 length:384 start_codon:yes stop_codon:yes gene_type:complete